MALTQMQLIQSLGEALAWLEREVNWGVPPTELRHLCGRIGELYACVMTNGQMANQVNQKGYDVVASNGEKISVKTTAMKGASGHISFNPKTLAEVDRVMILRVDTDEMQVETLFDGSVSDAMQLMRDSADKRIIPMHQIVHMLPDDGEGLLEQIRDAWIGDIQIAEYENGSIAVYQNGEELRPTRTKLRGIATALGVSLVNSNGNQRNTRQLGSLVIDAVLAQQGNPT